MKLSMIVLLSLLLSAAVHGEGGDSVVAGVTGMLEQQVEGWNRGSLDDYMGSYLRSDSLTFHSGGTLIRGWEALDAMYREKYSGDRRGRLEFADVRVFPLSDDSAYVIGAWKVQLPGGDREGRFTLIVRKTGEGWRIVHDHSS